jgi:hypothetical protein
MIKIKEIINGIDNLNIKKIDSPKDGNCGCNVMLKYLEFKHIDIKLIGLQQIIKKTNNNKDCLDIYEIGQILIYFNYRTIFKIYSCNGNYFYYGFNIKNINDNCFIEL